MILKDSGKKQKEKKMNAVLLKANEDFPGEGIIEYLEETVGISSTMVAGLLQVTERTLQNWKHESFTKLKDNSKSKRLTRLYEFIRMAEEKGVKKRVILNLLHEPIDSNNEESSSILHYIVHEESDALLKEISPLVIKSFMKDTKL